MSEDFYVFLTSNVNTEIGSQTRNTIGNFTTNLPEKIELNNNFEVAISDISYTRSWYNINEPEEIKLVCVKPDLMVFPESSFNLPPGAYETEEQLLKTINILMNTQRELDKIWMNQNPLIVFDSKSNKFKINLGATTTNLLIIPVFSQNLSEILGFVDENSSRLDIHNYMKFNLISDTPTAKVLPKGTAIQLEAQYFPQLNSIHTLYVYSDIISPRIVGNIKAPLFRQVEVPKNTSYGQDCLIKYKKRFYHPLKHFEFNTIQVVVKDDTGRDIDFKIGRVTVSLHFRKKLNRDLKKLLKW